MATAKKTDDGRRSPIVPHGSEEHRDLLGIDRLEEGSEKIAKQLEAQLRVPPVVATRETSVMHSTRRGEMVIDGWKRK